MRKILSWRSLWKDLLAFGPLPSVDAHKLGGQLYLRPMDVRGGYPQSWILLNRGVRIVRILNTNEYEMFSQPAYDYVLNTINQFTPVVAKREGVNVVVAIKPDGEASQKLTSGMIFDDRGVFVGAPVMVNGRLVYPSSRRDILRKFNSSKMTSLITHDAEPVRTVSERTNIPAGYTKESWERAVSDLEPHPRILRATRVSVHESAGGAF